MLNQLLLAGALLVYSLYQIHGESSGQFQIGLPQVGLYLVLLACGVAFFYSLMIALASTSIWFGRNQGLYDFWFYITAFARYPRSIYGSMDGGWTAGDVLQVAFTYVLPTPGGSGLSEGTAEAFFGQLLSPQGAVMAVLLFRALTFYLHILVGLVYLPVVGALRGVLEGRRAPAPEADPAV